MLLKIEDRGHVGEGSLVVLCEVVEMCNLGLEMSDLLFVEVA